MRKRFYKDPEGKLYPLIEAEWPVQMLVYRADGRKAKRNDPVNCHIARSICRNPGVKEAFIGSGKDAYIVYKARRGVPEHAVHFTIPAKAAKVRDMFDTKGTPATQVITLRPPTEGRTLDARSEMGKRRRARIKAGAPIKKRGPIKNRRITKLGIEHRPRARIIENGVIEVPVHS